MNKIAIINNLYFEEEKTLTEIAEIINTSISYISKILKKDKRYEVEKEKRKQKNLLQRREKQKECIYKNRKSKLDVEYTNLKRQHEQAVKELSKSAVLGKDALRKYCSSAYKYNPSKKRYEFDTESLLKPIDFPQYIKV